MRILHLVHRYAPYVGGSEEVVRQMSERLAPRGHDVTVLTRGAMPTPESGVEVRAVAGFRDYRRKLARLTQEAETLEARLREADRNVGVEEEFDKALRELRR